MRKKRRKRKEGELLNWIQEKNLTSILFLLFFLYSTVHYAQI